MPVIRLLEKLRLLKVLSKVDEGWEEHRRRIPRTVVNPIGTPSWRKVPTAIVKAIDPYAIM